MSWSSLGSNDFVTNYDIQGSGASLQSGQSHVNNNDWMKKSDLLSRYKVGTNSYISSKGDNDWICKRDVAVCVNTIHCWGSELATCIRGFDSSSSACSGNSSYSPESEFWLCCLGDIAVGTEVISYPYPICTNLEGNTYFYNADTGGWIQLTNIADGEPRLITDIGTCGGGGGYIYLTNEPYSTDSEDYDVKGTIFYLKNGDGTPYDLQDGDLTIYFSYDHATIPDGYSSITIYRGQNYTDFVITYSGTPNGEPPEILVTSLSSNTDDSRTIVY